jgi:hypothetical protein
MGGQARVDDTAFCAERPSGVHVAGQRCGGCYHLHCGACGQCQRCGNACALTTFNGRQGKLASNGMRLR